MIAIVSESRRITALALVLCGFSLLLYARILGQGFVWDDEGMFVNNPAIRSLANIPGFFLAPENLGAGDAGLGSDLRYYRPLLSTVHAVEYHFFGPAPLGYKVVNWLFNALVVMAAFLVAGSLLGNWATAFWGTLLYAAVPARTEVVCWVYSDSHLFATFFALAALLAWHRDRVTLCAVLMMAGLLFQEGVLLFLPTLLAYELLLRPTELRQRWKLLLLPLLIAAGYLLLRLAAVGSESGVGLAPITAGERLQASLQVFALLWRNLVWPEGMATVFIYREGMFGGWGGADILHLIMMIGAIWMGVLLWRRSRRLCFWYAWFFAWISLSLLIGPMGEYLTAEKALFLAALGPCMLVAAGFFEPSARRVTVGIFVVLTLLYSGMTWSRIAVWRDSVTYLQSLLAFEPDFVVGHIAYGGQLLEKKDFEGAKASFGNAIKLRPGNSAVTEFLLDCNDRHARDLAERGEWRLALTVLEESLKLSPQRAQTWNGIGIVRYGLEDFPGAKAAWQRALLIDPANVEVLANLDLVE